MTLHRNLKSGKLERKSEHLGLFLLCLAVFAGFVLLLVPQAHCQVHLTALGVKEVKDCPVLAEVNKMVPKEVHFPTGWHIYIACDSVTWAATKNHVKLWDKSDYAFTSVARGFTVINGEVFNPSRPDFTDVRPVFVLKHELGHILCACADEKQANKAGGN